MITHNLAVREREREREREEPLAQLLSYDITEMSKMWERVKNFVEKHHPNKAVAVRVMFSDNAMSHLCEILKRRQKQVSLDRFLVKAA